MEMLLMRTQIKINGELKAEECIKVFKNELIWLFTEFRWRMDG